MYQFIRNNKKKRKMKRKFVHQQNKTNANIYFSNNITKRTKKNFFHVFKIPNLSDTNFYLINFSMWHFASWKMLLNKREKNSIHFSYSARRKKKKRRTKTTPAHNCIPTDIYGRAERLTEKSEKPKTMKSSAQNDINFFPCIILKMLSKTNHHFYLLFTLYTYASMTLVCWIMSQSNPGAWSLFASKNCCMFFTCYAAVFFLLLLRYIYIYVQASKANKHTKKK